MSPATIRPLQAQATRMHCPERYRFHDTDAAALTLLLLLCLSAQQPMVVPCINYIRTGTYTSILYVSVLFMALHFPPDAVKAAYTISHTDPVYTTYVYCLMRALGGIPVAFAAGSLASFFRLRYFRVTVVNLFR